jgi:hypothetical protein
MLSIDIIRTRGTDGLSVGYRFCLRVSMLLGLHRVDRHGVRVDYHNVGMPQSTDRLGSRCFFALIPVQHRT